MRLSERYSSLRKFNKRANKHRNIRVGTTVETKRGIGIVTVRDGAEVWVAHESQSLLWCEQYKYAVDDVTKVDTFIDVNSKLFRGAWQYILDGAIVANQDYEVRRHEDIFFDREANVKGSRKDRDISMGTWGTTQYRRYTGVSPDGKRFDFELNCKRPFIPAGDRILYALGAGDGHITDMNGHGWIRRRKITDADINYGLAKYTGPQ